MVGDAATNAATKVRPSDEQLAQMDKPADDNTWHEKPDFSKDNLKNQVKAVYGGNPKEDAKDVGAAGVDAAVPPASEAQIADTTAGQNALKTAAKNKIDQKLDPETKEKLKQSKEEYRRKAREYLNKKMPEERRDQTIWRLKKMILECQQHPDYSQAVQTLLSLAETYGKHGRTLGEGSANTVKDTRTAFAMAESDLRLLIERFANGTSTSGLWEAIGQIYKDAQKDEELRNWFKKIDTYIRRCLLEQGYVLDEISTQQWNHLYDQGQYLLREKYRAHTDRVINEVKFLSDQFDQDPQNKAFGLAVQKLFLDLGNDENGNPVFKPHLVKDLVEVIIPAILLHTSYIPIPRIEYSDPQFDAIIENLVLESDNFMPNVAELVSDNFFRWGRKNIANKHKNTIEVKVSGIQMDIRDMSFHIKRKQGFPTITDTGVADILLPGEGFSFKIKMSTVDKMDRQKFFKVDKVDVDIKDMKLKIKQSSHKLLFSIARPFALRVIKPPMRTAIEKAIKQECDKLDKMLWQVKQEADRTRDAAKANPDEAPNFYKRYYDAWQKRALEGKEKAKAVSKDKQVNVAMTQEDSIFPKIKLPGGISSKATEYRELARKGDKWESPVFSIGSAKKSNSIPPAPEIKRKSGATGVTNGTNGATAGKTLAATNNVTNGHEVSAL